ncbi:MAG: hypothetical protein GY800_13590 [Planctomycetes bacterium]|nr:hypothetical protein [Planctomycetota bacterium]
MTMHLIDRKMFMLFSIHFIASFFFLLLSGSTSSADAHEEVLNLSMPEGIIQGTVLILIHSPDSADAEGFVERARAQEMLRKRELEGRVKLRVLSPDLLITSFKEAKGEAAERGASLILFRSNEEGWSAAVVDSGTNSPFSFFPVASEILFADEGIEHFLVPFSDYALGNVSEALESFLQLEGVLGGKVSGAGVWHFWVGTTLARLGESEEALHHFELASDQLNPEEGVVYDELLLARGQLLAEMAVFLPGFQNEALATLSNAIDRLQTRDERALAAAHIALGNYLLRVADPQSPQSLDEALAHLMEAEHLLVLPRDEEAWALLQQSVAATEVLLSVSSSEPAFLLEDALKRLREAKKVWKLLDEEARAEAATWQLRNTMTRLVNVP